MDITIRHNKKDQRIASAAKSFFKKLWKLFDTNTMLTVNFFFLSIYTAEASTIFVLNAEPISFWEERTKHKSVRNCSGGLGSAHRNLSIFSWVLGFQLSCVYKMYFNL